MHKYQDKVVNEMNLRNKNKTVNLVFKKKLNIYESLSSNIE